MINRNNLTKFCIFCYDNWDEDKDKLPTLNSKGKDLLSTIYSCSQGSIAKGTNGKNYILTGDNKWVLYSAAAGGSTGGQDNGYEINFVCDDDSDLKDAQFILEKM